MLLEMICTRLVDKKKYTLSVIYMPQEKEKLLCHCIFVRPENENSNTKDKFFLFKRMYQNKYNILQHGF